MIWLAGDGPECECDSCSASIEGPIQKLGPWHLCEECLADELAKAEERSA